ncbi:hypothetical protein HELRODRAFT_181926 [Helobdella robusta]|uniref:Neurotransmitter-gated ion-channel transmembrane domain-containing protein n=1 Tax=Helobdella robusta TaxID=6412 RepID=T1FHG8_HELRO|nr:hypothetical protein HELRODRAFT_181926 [Helobdella robusta]ESN91998.1 hypothetical protein HELRODRAFT_181926 [Helobdella robusta]
MIMVTIALVMSVIVTNIYSKKNLFQRCPPFWVSLAYRFYNVKKIPKPKIRKKKSRILRSRQKFLKLERSVRVTDGYRGDGNEDEVARVGLKLEDFTYTEILEIEWKMAAECTDRLFFWIFFLLSITVSTVLVYEMRPVISTMFGKTDNDDIKNSTDK